MGLKGSRVRVLFVPAVIGGPRPDVGCRCPPSGQWGVGRNRERSICVPDLLLDDGRTLAMIVPLRQERPDRVGQLHLPSSLRGEGSHDHYVMRPRRSS